MDDQLSDEGFTEIIKLVIEQLPIVGKSANQFFNPNKALEGEQENSEE